MTLGHRHDPIADFDQWLAGLHPEQRHMVLHHARQVHDRTLPECGGVNAGPAPGSTVERYDGLYAGPAPTGKTVHVEPTPTGANTCPRCGAKF
jgi:hypothetical protein